MENLSNVGRIFYGIAMAGMGFQMIYYDDFAYMMIPPNHFGIPGFVVLTYIFGTLLLLAGLAIVFEKNVRGVSLLLGTILLLIFCFYFVPYQFMDISNYVHLGQWENAEKELALAAGAFVIAGCSPTKNENSLIRFLAKFVPLGIFIYSIIIISFGIDHFLYAKEAADYIPSWIPNHLFWIYFAGVALLGSGIGIILKIKRQLNATLLGMMILIWVVILHIPKVIASPFADKGGELTSAFLALAYCGIALVIAGTAKNEGAVNYESPITD